jgi:hypothetical protein
MRKINIREEICYCITAYLNRVCEKFNVSEQEHPADIPLTQDTFRSNLERAIRTIAIEAFAAAYRRWLNQNKMCVSISGDYVQKS